MGDRLLPVLLVLLLLSGCATRVSPPPSSPATQPANQNALEGSDPPPLPSEVAELLDPAIEKLGLSPQIESYRIAPKQAEDESQGIVGYPIIEQGPTLDPPGVRMFTSILRDPRSYGGDLWCGEIQPGIAFRAISKSQTLVLFICFKCDEWRLYIDGRRIGGASFGGVQQEFLALSQHAFPNDPTLQAIPPRDTIAKIYKISDAPSPRIALSPDHRAEIADAWVAKIVATIGHPEDWDINGGRFTIHPTADNQGLIITANAKCHAELAAIKGLKPWPTTEKATEIK